MRRLGATVNTPNTELAMQQQWKVVLDAFELLHDIFVDESLHLNLSKPEFSISIFFAPLTKHSQPWNMNHHQVHFPERPLTTYPGTL